MSNCIRQRVAKYMYLAYIIALVALVFIAGCSPATHQNTSNATNSSNSVSMSTPGTNTLNTKTNIGPSFNVIKTGNSPSMQPTSNNFPDWLMDDLKLASNVKFPTKADCYAWDHNESNITVNYEKRINSNGFWKATGIDGQIWIGGYTGMETLSSYSTYAGSLDIKGLYQGIKNGSVGNHLDYEPMAPVLMFESNKITLVPAMSWDMGNAKWLAFAPGQVIIKMNHAGFDQYEVFNVPGIKIPAQ